MAAGEETESPKTAAERQGINLHNERSLHAGLKQWYAQPHDRFEVPVSGFVIDLVRGPQLVEIQTRNFTAIRPKLKALLQDHPVHLLHPVTYEKWVVQVEDKGGAMLSRRKSPYRGALTDLFEELVRLPDLVPLKGFTLEFALIREEEVRCRDGKGSKHRKKVSIKDRKLLEVVSTHRFSSSQDFLQFLPQDLPQPFSNRDLAAALALPLHRCRQITYCLRKMEALAVVGKLRNELLYEQAVLAP
ncbi:hypothetical protein ACD591_09075 [Rufibacter glacialis]|uniref:DUF8091 domain-containing protein n=1 Tax=Rufibacter glacialis TaxID=1259555 RepID=A0A5M8QBT2_9BACT|nr:hypothetical protein [Rufibacter glacialis]KAA6432414.1 hypothetical protein FOE74_15035 [Rufibacter glacialis]GGK78472.1 hypothetical protein GCM10011405_27910 [Rufibacter glacialis]